MYGHLSNSAGNWIESPKGVIATFAGYFHFLFNESNPLSWFILIMYLFLLVLSLRKVRRSEELCSPKAVLFTPGTFLLLWLVVPFVGVYIKSKVSAPILTHRNLIISLPAAYLLLSRSITQLQIPSRKQLVITCVIIALFLSDLTLRMAYYSKPHKEQFREAVAFIVERDHLYEDAMIIGYTHGGTEYLDYYFRKSGSPKRVSLTGGQEKDTPRVAAEIAAKNPQYLWYIHAHRIPEAQFTKFLDKNLKLLTSKNFVGAKVSLFDNK